MFSPRTPKLSVKVAEACQGKQGPAEWSIPASPFPGGRVCLNHGVSPSHTWCADSAASQQLAKAEGPPVLQGLPSSRDTARLSAKLSVLQEAVGKGADSAGSADTTNADHTPLLPCSAEEALASVRQEMLQQVSLSPVARIYC